MAEAGIDKVAITLRLNKDVELKCYPPIPEFFKVLTELVTGEAQGDFSNVIISHIPPGPDDVNKLWIEVNGQRNHFTQRVFINGKWQPWYFLPPNTYQWFDGRSPLPEGFKELGRVKTADLKFTGGPTAGSLPEEFILGSFVGY